MKYLLALLLLPTTVNAGFTAAPKTVNLKRTPRTFCFDFEPRIPSEGLRYCDLSEEYIQRLPLGMQTFHNELHRQVINILVNQDKLITTDEKIALKQFLLAADCLIQKNDGYAVELLRDAAIHLDAAKQFLAYCYRYGIGVGKRETTAKILLDLGCTKEERKTIDKIMEAFYRDIHLGL